MMLAFGIAWAVALLLTWAFIYGATKDDPEDL